MRGVVIKSTGSWYIVKTDDGELLNCRIRGKFRMQDIKSTNPIVVGDKVLVSNEDDSFIIDELFDRKNQTKIVFLNCLTKKKKTKIVFMNCLTEKKKRK